MNEPIKISPAALLATVLFHIDDMPKVKLKPDDSTEEIETEVPLVNVQKQGDSLVCFVPMKLIEHFATVPYHMNFQVMKPEHDEKEEKLVGAIIFERQIAKPSLVGLDGKMITSQELSAEKVLEKIKGQ